MTPSKFSHFRSFWHRLFPDPWILGILLILLFGVPRFLMVMHASMTGNSRGVAMIFTLMIFAPLLFYSKTGRQRLWNISMMRPLPLFLGFIFGGISAGLLFLLFKSIYGLEIRNAFVYIGSTTTSGSREAVYLIIYLAISMTFSPIGEELFYRGVVHDSFSEQLGDRTGAVIDSLAFALTHLAHFGLVHYRGEWQLFRIPALIWVSGMFLVSLFFNYMRRTTDSVLGAILAHAGFNFVMGIIVLNIPAGQNLSIPA